MTRLERAKKDAEEWKSVKKIILWGSLALAVVASLLIGGGTYGLGRNGNTSAPYSLGMSILMGASMGILIGATVCFVAWFKWSETLDKKNAEVEQADYEEVCDFYTNEMNQTVIPQDNRYAVVIDNAGIKGMLNYIAHNAWVDEDNDELCFFPTMPQWSNKESYKKQEYLGVYIPLAEIDEIYLQSNVSHSIKEGAKKLDIPNLITNTILFGSMGLLLSRKTIKEPDELISELKTTTHVQLASGYEIVLYDNGLLLALLPQKARKRDAEMATRRLGRRQRRLEIGEPS
ncbi:MAG: hypothetical protein LBM74_07405 [Oscillospiraceae bacterium]|jgi:hypothetical protein|nr:hypothetical protein [Oscillospiraceae bacterium]